MKPLIPISAGDLAQAVRVIAERRKDHGDLR